MSPKKSLVLALVCLSLAWLTACSGAQEQAQQPAATAPAPVNGGGQLSRLLQDLAGKGDDRTDRQAMLDARQRPREPGSPEGNVADSISDRHSGESRNPGKARH